jgi:endoglucanase
MEKMMRYGFIGVLTTALFLCPASCVLAEQGAAVFQDGERVCFIGDSITHGDPGSPDYHELIYLYYLTRFPDRKITIFDCGISGDSAQGAIQRFGVDIAPCRPTVSTIMLGMNDVGRALYEGRSPTCPPEVQANRDARLKMYGEKMEALCRRVVDSGSRLILLTPSPYDQVTKAAGPEFPPAGARVNDGLVRFSEAVRTLAGQFDAPVVDMNGGTLEVLERLHQTEPTRALCVPDRVHPNAAGQWVMAYLFLKAQHAPAVVSAVVIDAAGAKVVEQANGEVSELAVANDAVRFTVLAGALPFPLREVVHAMNENVVPFADELNREVLKVTGLRPGAYSLKIDGVDVGTHDAAELAAGVDLAGNPRTPQYRQAAQVATVNRQRDDLSCKLRGLALIEFTQLNRYKGDKADAAQVRAFFDEVLAGMEGKSWHRFFKGQFDNYLKDKPEEENVRAEIARLEQELFRINQPQPRRYELARTGDALPLPAAEPITEPKDLTFHLPFDKAPAAVGMPDCAPIEPAELAYEPGPVGDAVVIAGKQGLSYPEPEAFPLNESSIAFWIKPHWDPQDVTIMPLVFRKERDGLPLFKPNSYFNDQEIRFRPRGQGEQKQSLSYRSTSAPGPDGKPQTGGGSYGFWIVGDWGPGQWRHVCISVGNVGQHSKTRMYVQGRLVHLGGWDTPPQAHARAFTLGGGEHAMSIDDFRGYSRALAPEEVYELYRQGAGRAEFLNRVPASRQP